MDALESAIMWHIHDRNTSMATKLKQVGHSNDVTSIIIEYAKIDYYHVWKCMAGVRYDSKLFADRSDLMMIIFTNRFRIRDSECALCDITIPHIHIELHSLLDVTTEIADHVCTFANILTCLESGDSGLILASIHWEVSRVFGQKCADDPMIAKNVQGYLDMISW